ncbi:WGR domain-containing protein [Lignipirellula cremea]|uniref:NAD(+) ADP-ribosyltransferase n=1 Tax=Lignipirellula cremea TaxID=2528010 RepID=A0A518DMB0_9BACT|nr:WGR domain-containing protein [Lignipirellula cremea]QDU92977.1 Poly(ADP-ribose) polymerase catalytic domain protein [Lignipirellula cremea]
MAKKSSNKAVKKKAVKQKKAVAAPAKKAAKKTTTAARKAVKKTVAKKVASKASAVKGVKKQTAVSVPTAAKKSAKKTAAKTANKAVKQAAKKAVKQAVKKPAVKQAVKKTAVTQATVVSASAPSSGPAPGKARPVDLGKQPAGMFPEQSGPADFQCFGPPATRDGEFDQTRVCDMGCFTQDGKDSNKYYHGAVVQHKDSKNWYAYFEWGRTGAAKPSFQFVGCQDEPHAVREYAKQLHSKNDGRGEWVTIANIRTLRARKGKDCYLVRPQATRSTGLPDARSIKANNGAKAPPQPSAPTSGKKKTAAEPSGDPPTMSLLRDLSIATVAFTRGSMADDSIPTQTALDEARDILGAAQKRLKNLSDDVKKQVKDRELKELTTLMYGRIPKLKAVGAPPETWILSQNNILRWQNDIDAFESALYSTEMDLDEPAFDPLAGMRLKMEWLDPASTSGKFLHQWWPKATNNRHGYIGKMKIKNLWQVDRDDDHGKLEAAQNAILQDKVKIKERPPFQTKDRPDLPADQHERYHQSNTALLFHGTRSVNVSGILREAMRMPKQLVGVVITGAMFGPGLYFADDWKKSAGYTSMKNSFWTRGAGAVPGREAFMFAVEVALGNPFVAPAANGYIAAPDGHHCVFGKGGGATGLQNNEFVVFKPEQHRLRYLAEFSTT